MALRQRLNETVEDLDRLRREHSEVEVKCESVNRELTVAKADSELILFLCSLVASTNGLSPQSTSSTRTKSTSSRPSARPSLSNATPLPRRSNGYVWLLRKRTILRRCR